MSLSTASEPVPFILDEGGVARVAGTRVTLDSLIACYNQGYTAEDLHDDFDSVPLAELYAVIAYYLTHVDEVEAYLAERVRVGEELRRQIEAETGGEAWRMRIRERARGLGLVPD